MRINNFKFLLLFAALSLVVLPSLASATACGTLPLGINSLITACIPFNVINQQSIPTNTGLQVQIPLPSWMNGLTANYVVGNSLGLLPTIGLTPSNVFVNLEFNTIAANTGYNGLLYIYIGAPTTNFAVSGNNLWLAPNATSTYGQYFTGATAVFPQMAEDFYGTSMPLDFITSPLGGTFSINNGITVGTSAGDSYLNSNSPFNPQNTIEDVYAHVISLTNVRNSFGSWGSQSAASPQYQITPDVGNSLYSLNTNGNAAYVDFTGGSTTSNSIFTMWATASSLYGQLSYGTTLSNSGGFVASTSQYVYAHGYASVQQTIIQWVILRNAPPNFVNPTIQLGSVHSTATASLSISPNPVTYPTISTAIASCNTGDTCAVQSPLGTNLNTGTTTATNTIPFLTVGSYQYWANDLTVGTNSVPTTFTVNSNSVILTCTRNNQAISASQNFNSLLYNTNTVCNFPSYNNQVTSGNLLRNNIIQSSGNYVKANALWDGTFNNWVANVLSSQNYTSNSLSWTSNDIPYSFNSVISNATAYETTTQGFSFSINFTKFGTSVNAILQFNNGATTNTLNSIPINSGFPQWFNFSAAIPILASNNLLMQATISTNIILSNGMVINNGVTNTVGQTEKEAFPLIASNSVFQGVSNPITANSVVPYAYNHNINIFRNAVLQTNGQNLVTINSQSWLSGNYQINATDTVSGRMASANVIIYQAVLGTCGTVPPPYNTANAVSADNGVVTNALTISITDENTFNHIDSLSNSTGYMNIFGATFNSAQLGFSTLANQAAGSFCINLVSGSGQTINATGLFFYTTANLLQRQYIFNRTQLQAGVQKTLLLYTMNTIPTGAFTGNFNFYVTAANLQQLASDVQIFRFYPSTNSFKLVDFIQTSSTATTQATLQSGIYYAFNIYNLSLSLLGVLPLTQLNCIQLAGCAVPLPLPSNITTSFNYTNQIVHLCTFSNSTLILTCAVADATSSTQSYALNVTLLGVLGNTPQCLTFLNSPNGQLTCAIPSNTQTYSYYLTANEGKQTILLTGGNIGGITKGLFGATGYIVAFILILALSFLGVWHPVAMSLFDVFGILIVFLINLATLSVPLIINLVIVVMIQLWKMR